MKPNYAKIEDLLEILLARDVIQEWYIPTVGQYRINGVLDIYPSSQKYFYRETDERGRYDNLQYFLELIFN